jgi:hypothetical protein
MPGRRDRFKARPTIRLAMRPLDLELIIERTNATDLEPELRQRALRFMTRLAKQPSPESNEKLPR